MRNLPLIVRSTIYVPAAFVVVVVGTATLLLLAYVAFIVATLFGWLP